MRFALAVTALSLITTLARADPAADAGKALRSFVAAVATKSLPTGLDTMIGPTSEPEAAIPGLDDLIKMLDKPTAKIVATGVAPSGTAVWIAALVPGRVGEIGASHSEQLRLSAFLSLDQGTWRVRAAHWSGTQPNRPIAELCGLMDPWQPPASIPKDATSVTRLFSGLDTSEPKALVPLLSDDKTAMMFGSAPREQLAGGAAIKKIFKAWKIDLFPDSRGEHTRAGIAPGGDLAWVTMSMGSFHQCTAYRVMFVARKEGAAWKIIHQHYSEPVLPPRD